MTLSTTSIRISAQEPLKLVHFWSTVFGVPVDYGSTENCASLVTSLHLPALTFERCDWADVQRGHLALHLITDDLHAEVDRLKAAGVAVFQHGKAAVVCRDTEGNECIIRALADEAERISLMQAEGEVL